MDNAIILRALVVTVPFVLVMTLLAAIMFMIAYRR